MIRRPQTARRAPRKVGQADSSDDDDDEQSRNNGQCPTHRAELLPDLTLRITRLTLATDSSAAVRRPTVANRPKKTSTLRQSFGPDDGDEAEGEGSAVVKPKKKKPLGRIAVERNAERVQPSDNDRAGQAAERSSYSKEFLEELKQSTPSTPQTFSDEQVLSEAELQGSMDMDTYPESSALVKDGKPIILSEAEIRERKERRARLAAEHKAEEFISLDDDNQYLDEESGQLILRPTEKYGPESRLVRDDEDVLEGFDDYTEDSRLLFGRKAQREAKRKKRREMEEAIAAAEGDDGDLDDDNSDAERNAAYDAAQVRKGAYGLHRHERERQDSRRPKTPPRITAIPQLSDIRSELQARIDAKRQGIEEKKRKIEMLTREEQDIESSEQWTQKQLDEAAEQYGKMSLEDKNDGMAAGVNGTGCAAAANGQQDGVDGDTEMGEDGT